MRWCTLCVLLALTAPVHADSDPVAAAKVSKEAGKLAAAGKYVAAAAKFRAAHKLDPKPEYLCNVGVAYQRAKQLPRAQIYLGECLLRGSSLDAKFIALVRKALGTVEDKLRAGEFTPLEIVLDPPGALVTISGFDADEVFVGSRVVWVPFGTHTLTAASTGFVSATRDVVAQTRSQRQVRFDLTPVEVAPPSPVAGTVRAPVEVAQPAASRSKIPAIVSTAVTGVFGIAALSVFAKARGTMNDAASTTITEVEYDRLVDQGNRLKVTSWVFAGVAGAGAIVSGLLWYRATRTPVLEVTPTAGGAAVTLSGRW